MCQSRKCQSIFGERNKVSLFMVLVILDLVHVFKLELVFRKMTICFRVFLKFGSIFTKLLSGSKILYFQPTSSKYIRFPS